ncbi:MAG: hypothetical protein U5K84_10675 [Alkalibacterium sp.]|nr:hypothetical protein [Alkalibacterium sp.]
MGLYVTSGTESDYADFKWLRHQINK